MVGKLYDFFAAHRRLLLLGYLVFVVISIACFTTLKQDENIEALLPDTPGTTVRRDFDLLQQAPFARKILVDLHIRPGTQTQTVSAEQAARLKGAAANLVAALHPPLFNKAMLGPPLQRNQQLDKVLLQVLPDIVTPEDLTVIERRLTQEHISGQLRRLREEMFTLRGWWSKENIRQDPLQLWQIAAGHLRRLNPMSRADQRQLDFVSADGCHRLVVIDTPIAISDVAGSRRLIGSLRRSIQRVVPEDITATVVSGHMYTLANADTIQRDLKVVLGTATIAILVIFLLLLRSWRALFVFVLPASVLGVAAAAVAAVFPVVSGITIGFGAVLLGVTVDFTLHVFFAVRGSKQPQQQLRCLSAPLLGGAVTSFLAFGIMLNSALPGQRQLAIFSMSAIALALTLALVVMPHLCNDRHSDHSWPDRTVKSLPLHGGRMTLLIWVMVMVLSAVAIPRLHFDGDMHSLSVASTQLNDNEQLMRRVWGSMRSSALLFATGKTLDKALQVNDDIARAVQRSNPSAALVTLAAVLPSAHSQQHSRTLWRSFWQRHGDRTETLLTRAGQRYHFSPRAFKPFSDWLKQEAAPVTLATWRHTGLGDIISSLVVHNDDENGTGVKLISLLDEADLTQVMTAALGTVDNAIVVAPGIFSRQLSRELKHDFSSFIYQAFAMVIVVLIFWYRNWRHIVLALLPVVSGLLFMFGCMGWMGVNFNLFNVIAAILIIGLGVDYGIFMLSMCDGSGCKQSQRAVLVSALTTIAGFGSLVLAHHPAMYSIGISVLFGISGAVVTALLVLPTFYNWLEHGHCETIKS